MRQHHVLPVYYFRRCPVIQTKLGDDKYKESISEEDSNASNQGLEVFVVGGRMT
jgi:hypothetical protein